MIRTSAPLATTLAVMTFWSGFYAALFWALVSFVDLGAFLFWGAQ